MAVSAASAENLKTIEVDTSARIAYVSMRIHAAWDGNLYTGLRLYDPDEASIVDVTFYSDGDWYPLQEIPVGMLIIGLKCDSSSSSSYLLGLSLLLGYTGRAEVAAELFFPAMYSYPSYEQFAPLYAQGPFP